MFATQTSAAAAALEAKSTASVNQEPTLVDVFAVPAPRSVGKGLMCFCRKVYWTDGSLMRYTYEPFTKDETSKLLRHPDVINILSNPVSGSNLLTVTQNGAIVGVEQTVGHLQNTARSSIAKKHTFLKECVQQTKFTVVASAPSEDYNVPLKTTAWPELDNAPSSARKRPSTGVATVTSTPLVTKKDKLINLAERGTNSATIQETAKVNTGKVKSDTKTEVNTVESSGSLSKEIGKKANFLTADINWFPSNKSTKQSKALSDVQNRFGDNQDGQLKHGIRSILIKRKLDIAKTEESINKKTKYATPPADTHKVGTPVMFVTQTQAVTADLKLKSNVGVNQTPATFAVFAVQAPRSVGKRLLCLCRKVYWTKGSVIYCAYAPFTKTEASELLRDPNVLNILSNPVYGSNLLTVAENGAIVGVQQRVGYLQTPTRSSIDTKQSVLKSCVQQTNATVVLPDSASNQSENGVLKAADLPQPNSTPSSALTRASTVVPTSASTPMLLKIHAVFTLAEKGLNSVAEKGLNSVSISAAATDAAGIIRSGPKTKLASHEHAKALSKKIISKAKSVAADVPKCISNKSTKQSNVIKCDQNGQSKCDVRNANVKRRYNIAKSDASIGTNQKIITIPAGTLNVKCTWNKRWTNRDEKTASKNEMKNINSEIANDSESQVESRNSEIQQLRVETLWGDIVVNTTGGFHFAYDTKSTLLAINGTVPHLATQHKLSSDDLKRLGCSSSCYILQSITPPAKKDKTVKPRQAKKQLAVSALWKGPSLDALKHNPDFCHMPTGDKIAYLKEVLRIQRASLGISG